MGSWYEEMPVVLREIANVLKSFSLHPLTKGNRIGAFYRFLTWQISSRLNKGPIVYDWIDGCKFYVRRGEVALTQNMYAGLMEFEDMGFLLHFVRSGDLFVDVGANVGSYSILACGARGARGYAIEPVPSTYERLINNMRLNQIESRVKCLNIGIGSERGTIQFTSNMDATNHALPVGSTDQNAVSAEVYPLDDVLVNESPILMKVDVEGYETLMVEGAEATLKKESLQAVIIELNGMGNRYGWDDALIVDRMIDIGLNPYTYDPLQRKLFSLHGKNSTSGNTLFVRDEAFVLERVRSAQPVTVLGIQF
jgi:FkbM family methyltransferase